MKRFLIVCALAALVAGCAKPSIRVEQTSNIDFGAWGRYAWLERTPEERADARIDQDMLEREMRVSVNRQFKAKGFTLVETEREAQFLVRFEAELDDRFAFAEAPISRRL